VKFAFVIHRYGADLVGGSEYHCRLIAEKLAARHDVEVLTTTASDYITWKDGYAEGVAAVNGVTVRRFRVKEKRNLVRFKAASDACFTGRGHTREQEIEWVRANGPVTPDLIAFIREHKDDYDVFVFYSFRYYQTYFGLQEVAAKSILVPTAEEDPAVDMTIMSDLFSQSAGILFLTPEERDLVSRRTHGVLPPHEIIGFAVDVPGGLDPEDFIRRHKLRKPFLLYIGRIDRNKGCDGLFRYFQEYLKRKTHEVDLVLGGSSALPIPDHPHIKYLGFLSDREKFEALRACDFLVMPSPYESLCIVVLEAWKSGTCTLVNGLCKVLRGQSRRSNGGLYFQNFAEFCETIDFLLENPDVRTALGRTGREYLEQNFEWPHLLARIDGLIGRAVRKS
jgi:glycosyltransferase involved in cell wall biosynthesis